MPLSGVLDAEDPEGQPLTCRIVSQPGKGQVVITNDAVACAFEYTPNANANGRATTAAVRPP